jgi:hypothetical protein
MRRSAISRSSWVSALCLAAAIASAGSRPAAAQHPALAALEKAGTWKIVESPRVFGPEKLYEEIDGEAELFLPYGMKQLTVAIVAESSRREEEVRMELYRMESPRDAFGIYSQHRHPEQEIAVVPPSEVVASETSADFFRGETFVRLRAKPGEGSRRLVLGLAKDVVGVLPGDGAPPEEAGILDRFPGRTRGSVIYQRRSMLGYECLAPGFEAAFTRPSASGRVVLLPPLPGEEDARLSRLARELPAYAAISPALSRAELPSGPLWLSPAGRCVVGVAGEMPREEAERILETLAGGAKGACGPSR